MPQDFTKLGFDVQVDNYEQTNKRLGEIIKKLEKIQTLEGKKSTSNSSNGGSNSSSSKGLTQEEKWDRQYEQRVKKQAYYLKQGYIQQKDIISDHTKWTLEQEKKLAKEEFLIQQGYKKPKVELSQEEKITQSLAKQNAQLNSTLGVQQIKEQAVIDAKKNKIKQQALEEAGLKENTNSLSKYIAKLSSVVVIARKVGHFIASAVKEQASYIENLNLFTVTFGETSKETAEWALGLADSFGLASNEVIKFTGLFKQLSTALGIAQEVGDSMSKTLTQLGYDFASFYNISTESAMEKLQAGIFAGQVKPMRSIGIDLSYQQIDNLLKTNEALAIFQTSSKQMTQNQKAIARLILTLEAGSNAFGDMGETINTLQNQIRVFQGSMSNFRLAIGDLLEEPIRFVLTLLNALIIAMTRFIRSIVPMKTTSKNTAVGQLGEDVEETNNGIDELQGKLADFDKFNALSSNEENDDMALTNALVEELAKQQEAYEDSLKEIDNQAQELADELYECFVFAGLLMIVLSVGKIVGVIKSIGALTKSVSLLKGGLGLLNGVLVAGIIYAIVKFVEAIKEGDEETALLAGVLGVSLVGAFILLNAEMLKTKGIAIIDFFKKLFVTTEKLPLSITNTAISLKQVAIAGTAMMATFSIVTMILNGMEGEGKTFASVMFMVAGAIMAVVASMVALKGVQSWGTMLPVLLAGVGMAVAGVKGFADSLQGFADGGYTNANFIMTHENGKREWVGKQAGSSAIVNDTQMSDIMEMAVAKGVFSAMRANSAMGGTPTTNENIVVQIDGQSVFSAIRKVAKRQGVDFARV